MKHLTLPQAAASVVATKPDPNLPVMKPEPTPTPVQFSDKPDSWWPKPHRGQIKPIGPIKPITPPPPPKRFHATAVLVEFNSAQGAKPCPACGGSGSFPATNPGPGSQTQICGRCSGKGVVNG
jgi:hypothetical protein